MIPFSEYAAQFAFDYALDDYGTDVAEGFSMWCGKKFPHLTAETDDAATNVTELFAEWAGALDEWPTLLAPAA